MLMILCVYIEHFECNTWEKRKKNVIVMPFFSISPIILCMTCFGFFYVCFLKSKCAMLRSAIDFQYLPTSFVYFSCCLVLFGTFTELQWIIKVSSCLTSRNEYIVLRNNQIPYDESFSTHSMSFSRTFNKAIYWKLERI